MYSETEDVIRALAENAESVCRAYLPAGRRVGSYWIVGDLQNNPGRSLFVRLIGPASGPGAAGKFTDGATGEHGDLLDIIRERTGISRFPDLLAEARAHLGRPQPVYPDAPVPRKTKAPGGTPAAAARLFAASVSVAGTLADTYLRSRGITQGGLTNALRFHPKCWHRDEGHTRSLPRPALIAAVTDGAGAVQGVHRTWLAPDGKGKAPVETQRRAMGHLLGNSVRLTPHDDILVVGEGIETMLSLVEAMPSLPVWAALSSGHLGAVQLPDGVQRLYIAIDRDPAGQRAAERLSARATEVGIAARVLEPRLGDFNDDLRVHGADALRQHLAGQIGPEDRHRLSG
ncbi:Toprim domain protein [Roseovarius mucosus DSM 17069]|uniref:Toprim domain protein n=1 Tax=Roseovarius mucosus DSM 17069 TaxID=1288298 RepID=A0A0A0HI92_9RHOB|nr:toprim domain-containing protein [Roseovarius mucosus]KGM85863.1 Toprim domain protein [Roseovarius mucosus DSM 17069]